MSDLIGKSLGRYHILEQIGEGGMATVYKAHDTRLEADVAVKVIRTENLPPNVLERALKRFEREAKTLARLTHPNIVKVTDYGEFEGRPYLVIPYLPGGSLKKRLGKPIPWQEAFQFILPIARALDYAHRQNMIHRDVKPSNILITADGEPMLTDFGIAKVLDLEETADLTGTGMGIGTPEYMAPEQWQGNTSTQSDLYSLGVVLYEMITGRKPYTANTPAALLLKQANEPLPRPGIFVHDLPAKVEKILIKALTREPKGRFRDMGEFAKAIEVGSMLNAPREEPVKPRPFSRSAEKTLDTLATVDQDWESTRTPRTRTMAKSRTRSQPKKLNTLDSLQDKPSPKPWYAKWQLVILAGFILFIFAFFLIDKVIIQPPSPLATIPNDQSSIFDGNRKVTGIEIKSADNETVRVERMEDDNWVMTQPFEGEIDSNTVDQTVSQIYSLSVLNEITDIDDISIFGLNPPSYIITVISEDGSSTIIEVGDLTPTASGYYTQMDGERIVILERTAINEIITLWNSLFSINTPSPVPTELPEEIIDSAGVPMRLVPEGEFTMGSNDGDSDEQPVHQVYLGTFYMDKYEVTNTLYEACVNAGVCNPPQDKGYYTRSSYYTNPQYSDYPVVYVDWYQAQTYCEWRETSLPTEAEWEKAARGTDARSYPWGEGIECDKANYKDGCVGGTSPIGIYESGKSPYGIYDMAGNVVEWVNDWYDVYPGGNLTISDFFGQTYRVVRGGSWGSAVGDARSSGRTGDLPSYENLDISFRCARSVP